MFLQGVPNTQLKADENRTFIQKRRAATCPGLYNISNFMFPKISTYSRRKSCPFIPRRESLYVKILSTASASHLKIPVTMLEISLPTIEIPFFFFSPEAGDKKQH